ncbi:SRF-TF-domain-containing protein, partial [Laetiporus sulphureus 93-53]
PPDEQFITDHDAQESGADDDEDEEKPKSDKKAGRRKIKIEFIQDKSRRHITFSKRKAGIMKKAYELSTLTGTQVLLLVVSETGLVYTFTTAKLQPLVTQPEGKNLIQACLNAPHGTLPSSMPVGTPIGRSNPMSMPAHHQSGGPASGPNVPGGLAISGGSSGKDDADADQDDDTDAAPAQGTQGQDRNTRKRRRASSSAGQAGQTPTTPVSGRASQGQGAASAANAQASAGGANTSPHARTQAMPPMGGAPPLTIPTGQQQQGMPSAMEHSPRQPTSPNYTHASAGGAYGETGMYGAPPGAPQGYATAPGYAPFGGHDGTQGGAAGMQGHAGWGAPPQVQQGNYHARR